MDIQLYNYLKTSVCMHIFIYSSMCIHTIFQSLYHKMLTVFSSSIFLSIVIFYKIKRTLTNTVLKIDKKYSEWLISSTFCAGDWVIFWWLNLGGPDCQSDCFGNAFGLNFNMAMGFFFKMSLYFELRIGHGELRSISCNRSNHPIEYSLPASPLAYTFNNHLFGTTT